MRKLIAILLMLCIIEPCFAGTNQNKAQVFHGMPQGTFKKSWNGTIVQYNNAGKKIGKYKLNNGRCYVVK